MTNKRIENSHGTRFNINLKKSKSLDKLNLRSLS